MFITNIIPSEDEIGGNIALEGVCTLKGALHGVLLEKIESCYIVLFSDGNLHFYKNANSVIPQGIIDISSIKISSLNKTKLYVSFEMEDVCGYQYFINYKNSEHVNEWYRTILDVFKQSLCTSQKNGDEKSDESQNDRLVYHFKKYQNRLSQLNNYIKSIKDEYNYRLEDLKKDNTLLFKDLAYEKAKNNDLEVKCKELKKKTNDDLPQWWCKEHKKKVSMWRWCDDFDEYQFFDKETAFKFDQVPVGDHMKVKINNFTYVLQKETNSQGYQYNIETHKMRDLKRYEPVKNDFSLVKMHYNKKIIQEAINAFKLTVDGNTTIEAFVIQNEELYLKHAYLEKLWRRNKRCEDVNVKYLFHGANIDAIKQICSNGFNRIFNKRSVYGKGVYFARDADYSLDYADEYQANDSNQYKSLLYCRVLCGNYSLGQSNQKVPNSKKKSRILEETMVDDVNNPSIFVTTMDNQAYPLVLIRIRVH